MTEPFDKVRPGSDARPREVLSRILRGALERPPCHVAFSGGRDSSVILAAATDLARRERLAERVAFTLRFPNAVRAAETEWQEMVVRHLGLECWEIFEIDAELDLLGPVAAAGLRAYGLLYPGNAHLIVPVARSAAGGTVVTGIGGDDVFGNWLSADLGDALSGRRAPRRGDIKRAINFAAPRRIQAEVLVRRLGLRYPWIRAEHRMRLGLIDAAEIAGASRTWPSRMRWMASWRRWTEVVRSLETLVEGEGAVLCTPFLDRGLLASLATNGGSWDLAIGPRLCSGCLAISCPLAAVPARKADFAEVFCGAQTREFARTWHGDAGALASLVEPSVLRRIWLSPYPHFSTVMMLHQPG